MGLDCGRRARSARAPPSSVIGGVRARLAPRRRGGQRLGPVRRPGQRLGHAHRAGPIVVMLGAYCCGRLYKAGGFGLGSFGVNLDLLQFFGPGTSKNRSSFEAPCMLHEFQTASEPCKLHSRPICVFVFVPRTPHPLDPNPLFDQPNRCGFLGWRGWIGLVSFFFLLGVSSSYFLYI